MVLDFALPAALFVSIVQASREDLVKDIKLTIVSAIGIMACFMAVYFIFKYCFKKNTGLRCRSECSYQRVSNDRIPRICSLGAYILATSPSVALVVAIVGIVVNAIGIPVGLSLMNASLEKQNPGSTKKESAWKPVIHALEQPVARACEFLQSYG